MKNDFRNVDEYLLDFSTDIRVLLETIRATIQKAAPEATEKISYRMPAYFQNGILVYFAAFKSHIGFFPTPSALEKFKNELVNYKTSKGSVQFSYSKPIPYDLIEKMVKFRVKENLEKTKSK